MDPYRPPILSPEGSAEVEEEFRSGSALTPERRAMFERMNRRAEVRKRWAEIEQGLHDPDEPILLSEEGSREVLDEIENGSPLTPARAATFERMRQMADVHERSVADPVTSAPPPDHGGFVEVRSIGLREMRRKLATRRKRD